MHLSDQQLLELSFENKEHLSQCEACRVRAEHLKSVREKITSLPNVQPKNELWQQIKYSYQTKQQEQNLLLAKQKKRFWQLTSGALAAGFSFLIFWKQYMFDPSAEHIQIQNAQITALIQMNNTLQQQLENIHFSSHVISKTEASIELDILDNKLQQAYLNKDSHSEKLQLWQQRHSAMIKALLPVSPTNTLKI